MAKKKRDLSWMADQADQYGFRWGDVVVQRAVESDGYRILHVGHLGSGRLFVLQFSPTGRSVVVRETKP